MEALAAMKNLKILLLKPRLSAKMPWLPLRTDFEMSSVDMQHGGFETHERFTGRFANAGSFR